MEKAKGVELSRGEAPGSPNQTRPDQTRPEAKLNIIISKLIIRRKYCLLLII